MLLTNNECYEWARWNDYNCNLCGLVDIYDEPSLIEISLSVCEHIELTKYVDINRKNLLYVVSIWE